MSAAVLETPAGRRAGRRVTGRLRRGLPGLSGLALMAALLPFRGSWTAGIVLLALTFTVPGILLLRAVRVSGRAVREYPLYIPAAAIAVVLAAGLGANLVGPLAGVPRPLHGDTTALTTLGVSLVLWATGLPAPGAARLPWRRTLQSPTWLAPLALPLVAAVGALLLSHGHGATVARAGQGLTALVLLAALLLAPRLRRGQLATLLFACSLAAEWAFSLRSQEVVGYDITTEIGIAQHVLASGVWSTLNRGNAYSAMLSVTVLPSTLHALTGVSPLIAFKVVYPILTALLPVSVFLLGERVMRRGYAAAAAGLLIVQTYFFEQLPELARQEVALLFFAALVAALIENRTRRWSRLALITVLGAGLVVSHYSSTYLAIPIVVIALIISVLISRWRTTALMTPLLCAGVILLGGAGVWYVAVTHSSSNLAGFGSELQHHGLNLLPNAHGNIFSSYLSGNVNPQVSARRFQRLAVGAYRRRAAYINPLPAARQARFDLRSATVKVPKRRLPLLPQILQWISIAFAELLLVLGVLGAVVMALRRRSPTVVRQLGVLAFGTVAVLVVIRFSGTVATYYNQSRALAQSLLLLALPAAWLAQQLLDRFGRIGGVARARGRVRVVGGAARRLRVPAAVVLLLSFPIMLAYDSTLTAVLTGGGTLLNLSGNGEDFQRQYMTPAELSGAAWATDKSHKRLLYADPYGQLRLNAASGAIALNVVTPETINRRAWVYGTHTNVVLGTARGQAGNDKAIYAWPNRFLNAEFDTVFTDGDSKVYHR